VNVESLKRQLILLCALGVGVSVAFSGVIGFVGLVVPHLVRLLCGPDHRVLLPLSALLGALLLAVSDLMARTILSPAELPVGLLTALFGAPFFLLLLFKQRRHWAGV
jgi:iron complex transport system permease protein